MSEYEYSPKTLKVGTIGGNGFWLMSDCVSWMFHATEFPRNNEATYNTNDQTSRSISDGTTLKKVKPYFGDDTRLVFASGVSITHGLSMIRYYGSGAEPYFPWKATPITGLVAKKLTRPGSANPALQHMDYVQFVNLVNFPCIACERIQVGNPGYTDVLPGLYLIEVKADSVKPSTCKVLVKPFDNSFAFWTDSRDYPRTSTRVSYGTLHNPYLNDTGITVSIAPDNWNLNIIPGLNIRFASDIRAGDAFVIAIGYEYVNARGQYGQLGEINGCEGFFLPIANFGIQTFGSAFLPTEDVFHVRSSDSGWSSPASPVWTVFNTSGEVLDGVAFHLWPLVRLQQNVPQRPFAQWFMGCSHQTQFPESSSQSYRVRLVNVTAGVTGRKADLDCSHTIDRTVKEIDPVTFQETGNTRVDGKGLKCDGVTLYLWEAAGVHFVISADATENDAAHIHVRKGPSHLMIQNKQALWDSYPSWPIGLQWDGGIDTTLWRFGPLDYPIGTWGRFTGESKNFDNGDVVDKGNGKVGLPATAHGKVTGESIRISGSSGYSGEYKVDADSSANELVIVHPYVEETLNGASFVSIYPGDDCLPESYHTGRMAYQGYEFVFSCPNHGTRTQWYDHYFSIGWNGYRVPDSHLMDDNPFEAALVITCNDPRYFKVIPVTWLYNPDQTGTIYHEPEGWGSPHIAKRSLRAIQQIGEPHTPTKLLTSLNVADIDRSLVIRLNQVASDLAELYEELGIQVED